MYANIPMDTYLRSFKYILLFFLFPKSFSILFSNFPEISPLTILLSRHESSRQYMTTVLVSNYDK